MFKLLIIIILTSYTSIDLFAQSSLPSVRNSESWKAWILDSEEFPLVMSSTNNSKSNSMNVGRDELKTKYIDNIKKVINETIPDIKQQEELKKLKINYESKIDNLQVIDEKISNKTKYNWNLLNLTSKTAPKMDCARVMYSYLSLKKNEDGLYSLLNFRNSYHRSRHTFMVDRNYKRDKFNKGKVYLNPIELFKPYASMKDEHSDTLDLIVDFVVTSVQNTIKYSTEKLSQLIGQIEPDLVTFLKHSNKIDQTKTNVHNNIVYIIRACSNEVRSKYVNQLISTYDAKISQIESKVSEYNKSQEVTSKCQKFIKNNLKGKLKFNISERYIARPSTGESNNQTITQSSIQSGSLYILHNASLKKDNTYKSDGISYELNLLEKDGTIIPKDKMIKNPVFHQIPVLINEAYPQVSYIGEKTKLSQSSSTIDADLDGAINSLISWNKATELHSCFMGKSRMYKSHLSYKISQKIIEVINMYEGQVNSCSKEKFRGQTVNEIGKKRDENASKIQLAWSKLPRDSNYKWIADNQRKEFNDSETSSSRLIDSVVEKFLIKNVKQYAKMNYLYELKMGKDIGELCSGVSSTYKDSCLKFKSIIAETMASERKSPSFEKFKSSIKSHNQFRYCGASAYDAKINLGNNRFRLARNMSIAAFREKHFKAQTILKLIIDKQQLKSAPTNYYGCLSTDQEKAINLKNNILRSSIKQDLGLNGRKRLSSSQSDEVNRIYKNEKISVDEYSDDCSGPEVGTDYFIWTDKDGNKTDINSHVSAAIYQRFQELKLEKGEAYKEYGYLFPLLSMDEDFRDSFKLHIIPSINKKSINDYNWSNFQVGVNYEEISRAARGKVTKTLSSRSHIILPTCDSIKNKMKQRYIENFSFVLDPEELNNFSARSRQNMAAIKDSYSGIDDDHKVEKISEAKYRVELDDHEDRVTGGTEGRKRHIEINKRSWDHLTLILHHIKSSYGVKSILFDKEVLSSARYQRDLYCTASTHSKKWKEIYLKYTNARANDFTTDLLFAVDMIALAVNVIPIAGQAASAGLLSATALIAAGTNMAINSANTYSSYAVDSAILDSESSALYNVCNSYYGDLSEESLLKEKVDQTCIDHIEEMNVLKGVIEEHNDKGIRTIAFQGALTALKIKAISGILLKVAKSGPVRSVTINMARRISKVKIVRQQFQNLRSATSAKSAVERVVGFVKDGIGEMSKAVSQFGSKKIPGLFKVLLKNKITVESGKKLAKATVDTGKNVWMKYYKSDAVAIAGLALATESEQQVSCQLESLINSNDIGHCTDDPELKKIMGTIGISTLISQLSDSKNSKITAEEVLRREKVVLAFKRTMIYAMNETEQKMNNYIHERNGTKDSGIGVIAKVEDSKQAEQEKYQKLKNKTSKVITLNMSEFEPSSDYIMAIFKKKMDEVEGMTHEEVTASLSMVDQV